MKKKTLIIITVFFFILSKGMAQHNHGGDDHSSHSHEENTVMRGPNGGEIKQVNKYKIEIIAELFYAKDQLKIFLYKKNMKPLNGNDIKGKIAIEFHDGTKEEYELELRNNNSLVGQLSKTDGFHAIVEITIDGKKEILEFHNKGLETN